MSERRDLAAALFRLAADRTPIEGFADHLVSEAIYLPDPDGNGIEHPGASGVWDALGEALAGPLDDREQVAVCELDFDAQARLRA
ncbi:MAG: hypothetical protein P1P87_15940, partial [Trueperaceae bacterium]|nr:hypothetical protein [Trueperaceae bacterium]